MTFYPLQLQDIWDTTEGEIQLDPFGLWTIDDNGTNFDFEYSGNVRAQFDSVGKLTLTEPAGDTLALYHDGVRARIISSAGYCAIGTSSSSAGLSSPSDLFVTGQLECGGNAWLEGAVTCGSSNGPSIVAFAGHYSNGNIRADTVVDQACFLIGLQLGRQLVFADAADYATDWGHDTETDFAMYIQSSDATDLTQYLKLQHNQNYAIMDSGKGGIKCATAFKQSKGTDVASAATITFSEDGNQFDITGTTQTNYFDQATLSSGQWVALQFDGIVALQHAEGSPAGGEGEFRLDGAVDKTTTAGDRSMFYFDGTDLIQVTPWVSGAII